MRRGFTLIELLIVITIIAILSSIMLVNYLESTVRAKVSRTHSDMRVTANALEMYFVDHNTYIHFLRSDGGSLVDQVVVPMSRRLSPLTTPVAYITTVPLDIFGTVATADGSPLVFFDTYDYADVASMKKIGSNKGAGVTSGGMWRLSSPGPDRIQAFGGDISEVGWTRMNRFGVDYDPTNGTVSAGDIVRVGPPSREGMEPGIRRAGTYEENFRAYERYDN
jgi:prepilin-type N-terminal cleavage/methylation domain-containing protein